MSTEFDVHDRLMTCKGGAVMDGDGSRSEGTDAAGHRADVRAPLRAEVLATEGNARELRRQVHDWLTADIDADSIVVGDLVLAVYEAMANAVEHAYADSPHSPGFMCVEAHRTEDDVRITVSDEGTWRTSTPDRFRGRGLPLMRELTHAAAVDRSHSGTTVYLRADIGSPASAEAAR